VLADELGGLPEFPLGLELSRRLALHSSGATAVPRMAQSREAAEHVLQVDHRAGVGGGGEERYEAGLHLLGDDTEGVGAHGDAAELEAGHLALVAPRVAVDVEDAAAEEVPEESGEGLALGEVVEVGPEHVLDVGRVGGDGAAEDVDVDGGAITILTFNA